MDCTTKLEIIFESCGIVRKNFYFCRNNRPHWLAATSPNLGEEYIGYLVERSDKSSSQEEDLGGG